MLTVTREGHGLRRSRESPGYLNFICTSLHVKKYTTNIYFFCNHSDVLINKYLLLRIFHKLIRYILGKVIHHLCSISVLTIPPFDPWWERLYQCLSEMKAIFIILRFQHEVVPYTTHRWQLWWWQFKPYFNLSSSCSSIFKK